MIEELKAEQTRMRQGEFWKTDDYARGFYNGFERILALLENRPVKYQESTLDDGRKKSMVKPTTMKS